MKKLFGLTFFTFFLSLSSAYAQQGSSGGGPSLGNGTFSVMNPHEVRDFRDSINPHRVENPFLIQINEEEIEALTTVDGDYARLEDLKEGFVRFLGVSAKNGFLELNIRDHRFDIEYIHFENGTVKSLRPTKQK